MYDDTFQPLCPFLNSAHFIVTIPLPNGLDSITLPCYGYLMNKTQALIKSIEEADAIERATSDAISSILRNACDELQSLQDRIDAGEFNV